MLALARIDNVQIFKEVFKIIRLDRDARNINGNMEVLVFLVFEQFIQVPEHCKEDLLLQFGKSVELFGKSYRQRRVYGPILFMSPTQQSLGSGECTILVELWLIVEHKFITVYIVA